MSKDGIETDPKKVMLCKVVGGQCMLICHMYIVICFIIHMIYLICLGVIDIH